MLHPLPSEASALLTRRDAPARLIRHLTIVHAVAVTITEQLQKRWSALTYDREAVLLGAALHDIGKLVYPEELSEPGNKHEEIGPQLLSEEGFSTKISRFARTHARWQQEKNVQLEDLLVAFADTIWKGQRDDKLEQALALQIAQRSQQELWQVYTELDDIASELNKDAHQRIFEAYL